MENKITKNINNKVYLIGMVETLINNHNQTDLGTHLLEYKRGFTDINSGDAYIDGDGSLGLAVRLKNKENNIIEWGEIYYKPLMKNTTCNSREGREEIEKRFNEILMGSVEDKMKFITRLENKILKRPYAKDNLVDPVFSDFFKNLNFLAYDYPAVSLGGKFPKEQLPFLNVAFDIVMDSLPQQFSVQTGKQYK